MNTHISKHQAYNLVARATERHPHLESRLTKAADIAQFGYIKQLPPGPWVVGSASTTGKVYIVDTREKSCTCPDFGYRGGWCAHRLAVAMVKKAAQEAQQVTTDGLAYALGMCAA